MESETRADYSKVFRTAAKPAEQECTETIDELIDCYGNSCVLEAFKQSKIAEEVAGVSSHAELSAVITWILSRIIDSRDPRKEADIMALASGMLLREGITITDVARKYGVSKQDISRAGIEFCTRFGLPPSHAQLPISARERYRLANRRNIKR